MRCTIGLEESRTLYPTGYSINSGDGMRQLHAAGGWEIQKGVAVMRDWLSG
ncbi:MAG TPA: hypothetical protein P5175_04935 [Anaerohalosphaeraceae bacterium]|nr:hypothetical protein [Anaerohalosphaeraceae bacterium]HOM76389.1 hypothetical protein [Anaerohalosphaeraceae bacterium]HPO70080.1 hypothetical protein [Anaerohalosphaeraceae bacterium]HRS71179.1 hypothetical protein [Anaerohalosphaeraceae bacterium]HRV20379.1 hypothetical protein [Anaerohalosphaeraceae bacterium]